MIRSEAFAEVAVASPAELWDWLAAHHGQAESVWLVTWKKSDPGRYVSRDEVLDALIAHGWIDGIRRKRDDGRTMQLISPRKQQAWVRSYKDRAARLEAEGRMAAPGRAAIAAAKAAGRWEESDPVDDLVVPGDLAGALAAREARAAFDAMAPSYRRNVLRWIAGARRDDTRRRRIEELAARTARGEKVPQF